MWFLVCVALIIVLCVDELHLVTILTPLTIRSTFTVVKRSARAVYCTKMYGAKLRCTRWCNFSFNWSQVDLHFFLSFFNSEGLDKCGLMRLIVPASVTFTSSESKCQIILNLKIIFNCWNLHFFNKRSIHGEKLSLSRVLLPPLCTDTLLYALIQCLCIHTRIARAHTHQKIKINLVIWHMYKIWQRKIFI